MTPDPAHKDIDKTSGPVWIAAIVAATGLLAALIISILRLGRPRRRQTSPYGYKPVMFPTQITGADPAAISPSTAQSSGQSVALQTRPFVTNPTTSAGIVDPTKTPNQIGALPIANSTRWSHTTKYLVGVGLFLSIGFWIFISRGSLPMIIIAALIAFVARPTIGWFQRRLKLKRSAATGITYLVAFIILITLPLLLIPPIIDGLNYLLNIDTQAAAQNLNAWLQAATVQVQSTPVIGAIFGPLFDSLLLVTQDISTASAPEAVEQVTIAGLTDQLAKTLGFLVNVVGPLVSLAISFIFMFLISLHMSLSSERLHQSYPKLIPEAYRPEVSGLINRIVNVWTSFLHGQLSLMFVMGFLTFLLNWLLGTPYPVFLGFLAGLLEIIPSLGPVLATIPAVLLALFVGSTRFTIDPVLFALIVILGYVLLSLLENQVMVPKILGDAVSLPPLVVILGCVIFGALFGILGIFLSTPVISTGKEIYSYLYDKILEPPPEEKPPEEKPGLWTSLRSAASKVRLPWRRKAEQDEPAGTVPEI